MAARMFLLSSSKGARDASVKFADARERGEDRAITAQFASLLTDLEKSFTNHRLEVRAQVGPVLG